MLLVIIFYIKKMTKLLICAMLFSTTGCTDTDTSTVLDPIGVNILFQDQNRNDILDGSYSIVAKIKDNNNLRPLELEDPVYFKHIQKAENSIFLTYNDLRIYDYRDTVEIYLDWNNNSTYHSIDQVLITFRTFTESSDSSQEYPDVDKIWYLGKKSYDSNIDTERKISIKKIIN